MKLTDIRKALETIISKIDDDIVFLDGNWENPKSFPFCSVMYNGLNIAEANDERFCDPKFAIAFLYDVKVTESGGIKTKDYMTAAEDSGDIAKDFVNALISDRSLEVVIEQEGAIVRYEQNGIEIAGTEVYFTVIN